MKREELKLGDIYCAKILRTNEIIEGKVHDTNNGFGQIILQRIDDLSKCMVWDIDNTDKNIIFYKKNEVS